MLTDPAYPPLTETDLDALARMGLPRSSLDLPKENTTMTNQKTPEQGGATESCVFCAKIASEALWMDSKRSVVSFTPLGPVVPGHRLFVPYEHVTDASTAADVTGRTFAAAAEWAAENGVEEFNLITSAGTNATQSIFHLHVHLVPRIARDGLTLPWTGQKRAQGGVTEAQIEAGARAYDPEAWAARDRYAAEGSATQAELDLMVEYSLTKTRLVLGTAAALSASVSADPADEHNDAESDPDACYDRCDRRCWNSEFTCWEMRGLPNPHPAEAESEDHAATVTGDREKLIAEAQKAAWAEIHGQDPRRKYSVDEVKRIVYSLDNAIAAALSSPIGATATVERERGLRKLEAVQGILAAAQSSVTDAARELSLAADALAAPVEVDEAKLAEGIESDPRVRVAVVLNLRAVVVVDYEGASGEYDCEPAYDYLAVREVTLQSVEPREHEQHARHLIECGGDDDLDPDALLVDAVRDGLRTLRGEGR